MQHHECCLNHALMLQCALTVCAVTTTRSLNVVVFKLYFVFNLKPVKVLFKKEHVNSNHILGFVQLNIKLCFR